LIAPAVESATVIHGQRAKHCRFSVPALLYQRHNVPGNRTAAAAAAARRRAQEVLNNRFARN